MEVQSVLVALAAMCIVGGLAAFAERFELVHGIAEHVGWPSTIGGLSLFALLLAWPEMQEYQHVYKGASAVVKIQNAENAQIDAYLHMGAPGADEEFGFDRLEAVLARSGGMSAETVKEQVLSAWRTFTRGDEPEDDRTLVVLRVREDPPSAST